MEQEEPLIRIGEYMDLRNHTNRDLLRVIKELKQCIEDYKKYDAKQKELIRQCDIRIGIQNSRIKHQKKAITDLLKAINSNESHKIDEEYILNYLDTLYNDSMVEARNIKEKLGHTLNELNNCKVVFRNATGVPYDKWKEQSKIKKEERKKKDL